MSNLLSESPRESLRENPFSVLVLNFEMNNNFNLVDYDLKMHSTVPQIWRLLAFLISGIFAGISNGVAGGGTFLSFPTLLAMGIPTLQANISSTVGLFPSTLGGISNFRKDLSDRKKFFSSLLIPCLLGSLTGSFLLLTGSVNTFQSVVPWLIGIATALFALAPRIKNFVQRNSNTDADPQIHQCTLYIGIFIASIYGGYFGAGLGIILLSVLALALPFDIHILQGIRSFLGFSINLVAGIIFIIHGNLAIDAVYTLLIGALIGGILGTMLIQKLSARLVRGLVIVIGIITTIKLGLSA